MLFSHESNEAFWYLIHVERTIRNSNNIRHDKKTLVKAIRTTPVSALFSKIWQLFWEIFDISGETQCMYIVSKGKIICTRCSQMGLFLYPPQTMFGGVYRNHFVRPSVRPSVHVSATPPERLIGFLWNFTHL